MLCINTRLYWTDRSCRRSWCHGSHGSRGRGRHGRSYRPHGSRGRGRCGRPHGSCWCGRCGRSHGSHRPCWRSWRGGPHRPHRSYRPCRYNGFCWCRRPYGSDRTGWCGDTRCGCNGCHQYHGYCDPIQSAVGQHADSRPAVQLTRKRTIQLDLNTKEGRRTAPPLLAQRRRSYENCCVCHLQK